MFSFTKASGVVLLALVSLVQATITITSQDLKVNSTESSTIKWTSSDPDQDPESFTIELINAIFNSQFALGNNVPTSLGTFTFSMPSVLAGAGYKIEFVQVGNINNIFSQTGDFSLSGSVAISTNSGASTSASSTTGTSSGTASSSTTKLSTSSGVSTVVQTSSGATSTAPASAGTSGLATSATSASAPASTTTSAATGIVPAGSFAALVAAAVALLF